ncbi:MAG TPA: DegT/DnrJ/EryC1/StrS family aminotransferase [Acidobacteriota bacterium]|nr:DegT/DnrJ/EryC1/StrS family aminotransferase [Acidobacteriota bacterium]
MSSSDIPIFRPAMGDEEAEAIREVFASGWVGPGPKAQQFEERFAEFVGASYGVTVTSCTAAMHLTCLGLGIGPEHEVLVPSLTFVSTAHAARYCGAKVVFVDVDPETGAIDPADLRSKITSRSKAVIPVHYGGHPAPMDLIWEIAEQHGLLVIEDAAHACGAEYKGQRVGGSRRSHAVCFSFNAVKNLSTGDGGMVATHSQELAGKVRDLRWMGIEKSTYDRSAKQEHPLIQASDYRWFYEIHELGYKYIMNDVAAAMGLVQLSRLPEMQKRRQEMARRYSQALGKLDWLKIPIQRPDVRSAWHLYPLRTPHRESLADHLRDHNIATSVHYFPIHLQPYYRERWTQSLPTTEKLWKELLTIPFHPALTDEEAGRVIQAVASFKPVAEKESA